MPAPAPAAGQAGLPPGPPGSARRALVRALALVAAAGTLAACGASGDRSDASAEPAVPEVSAAGGAGGEHIDQQQAAPPTGPRQLVDATTEWGIDTALTGIRGHAVASADVNGDGWADLFVGTFADRPTDTYQERGADGPAPDRLLLGSATGFTVDPGFEGRLGRSAGALFDDLDGDGDPDLVVSRNVSDGARSGAPSEIYRNDGGSLVPSSVLDDRRGGRAVVAVDFDGDGLRDLVLVEDRWSGGATGLFRNEGDLRFAEVTSELGFPGDVDGLGAAVGDLDGDGIDDLVVGGSNRWFLGDGSGFSEGSGSPLAWDRHGDEDDPAQVVLADTDGDGRLDILIGQHFNSTLDGGRAEPVRLYLNRAGDGAEPQFEDATEAAGLPGLATKSPQLLLADVDGDGHDDLVTTASYPTASTPRMPLVAYDRGDGGDRPHFAAPEVEVGPHYWIDGVTLDANRDGTDDLFFVEWEPSIGSSLFLNLPVGTG